MLLPLSAMIVGVIVLISSAILFLTGHYITTLGVFVLGTFLFMFLLTLAMKIESNKENHKFTISA